MGPLIGRELADDVRSALTALLEWRLPPVAWDEMDRLLTELGAAVDVSDAAAVDKATAQLETCGRRVLRIGRGTPDPSADDGRTAAPRPVRERAVALLHRLEPRTAGQRDGDPAAEDGSPPSRS
ncbi:CATRA system-associated protein [Streptomyces sp. NPDC057403]|uniref:CATRA system-associated protein n=1 Tax=Streptomyces sp. NPDC057403 TaxID=3346119 RepID=UPI003696C2CB